MPKKEESKLIVDHNTKEALHKEMLKKMSKLKVHSVGIGVNDNELIPGAMVLVDPAALSKAQVVNLSDELDVLLVTSFDIIHIW